tara:strand:- start:4 stop:264 length:261 start_codon:yes stop_codon:yes gene_type:complete
MIYDLKIYNSYYITMTIIEKEFKSNGTIEVSEYIIKRRQKQLKKGKTLKLCIACNKNIKYYNFCHHLKSEKHELNQKIYDLKHSVF